MVVLNDIQFNINLYELLIPICQTYGSDIEIVKFIFKNTQLTNNIQKAFVAACRDGHIEIIIS